MEEIQIKNNRQKYLVLLIAAMGFVAGGIFMILHPRSPADRWIGWMSLIFFGSGVPLFGKKISESGPRLIINDQGIFDRTLGIGTIPWSEITGAYIKSIKDNDFICLELRNPEMWSNQLSGIRKAAVSANKALGFTEFSVNLVGAAADATAIHELIIKKIAERSTAKR
jgi:hypothetical protein